MKPVDFSYHKLGCAALKMALGLEFLIKGEEGLYYMCIENTIMLLFICAVTTQLICSIGFAYPNSRFLSSYIVLYIQ